MAKFDKYVLSQLMVLFGFFSLVLVMVYWINRAVVLFDQLIANGHSALVFLEFSSLTLPNVIRLVLPIAAFIATLYCGNRLATDSELVVVQSTGFSPTRLAFPVFVFGLIVAAIISILAHFLVPASLTQLKVRQVEIQANATARFLREGTFFHPATGFTFYIGEISPEGELQNVFITDNRSADRQTTYTASRAHLATIDGSTKLYLQQGLAQFLQPSDMTLSTTQFRELVLDITPLMAASAVKGRRANEMSTSELLWPTAETQAEAQTSIATMKQIGHDRFAQATFAVGAALVGFSALLLGGFSRFGLWRQITGAVFLIVLLKILDNLMNDLARQDPSFWPLVYVPTCAAFLVAGALLWWAAQPRSFRFRSWKASQ